MILPNPRGQMPKIDPTAFVAPNATIVGDVTIGPEANIWFGAVLRADWGSIKVGARTSIQDNAVMHIEIDTTLEIGDDCIIGHGAIVHGLGKIGNKCLIGIASTVLQGTTIGDGTLVAAEAVVRGVIKEKVLIAGVPGEVKRQLSDEIGKTNVENAQIYVNNGKQFKRIIEELSTSSK